MTGFDMATLTPAKVGTLEKHLSRMVRVETGEVMTFRECYTRPLYVGKRAEVVHVWGRSKPALSYDLVKADGAMTEVPKLVWDAITLPVISTEEQAQ